MAGIQWCAGGQAGGSGGSGGSQPSGAACACDAHLWPCSCGWSAERCGRGGLRRLHGGGAQEQGWFWPGAGCLPPGSLHRHCCIATAQCATPPAFSRVPCKLKSIAYQRVMRLRSTCSTSAVDWRCGGFHMQPTLSWRVRGFTGAEAVHRTNKSHLWISGPRTMRRPAPTPCSTDLGLPTIPELARPAFTGSFQRCRQMQRCMRRGALNAGRRLP